MPASAFEGPTMTRKLLTAGAAIFLFALGFYADRALRPPPQFFHWCAMEPSIEAGPPLEQML